MNDSLKRLASRIGDLGVLLADARQATIHNFTFGALYALAKAEELGYENQTHESGEVWRRPEEVKALSTRMLTEDRLPEQGEWLAGFYFNDAIFRADVAFQHLLRYVASLEPEVPLGKATENLPHQFPSELLTTWVEKGRKVDSGGKDRSLIFGEHPGISFGEVVAVIENLVCALDWILANPPSRKTQ